MSQDTVYEARIELIAGHDVDDNELDHLSSDLRTALLEYPVADVSVPPALPEAGSKSGVTVEVGVLLVTATPLVLKAATSMITAWLENRPVRKITLKVGKSELSLDKATRRDERRVVDEFFRQLGE